MYRSWPAFGVDVGSWLKGLASLVAAGSDCCLDAISACSVLLVLLVPLVVGDGRRRRPALMDPGEVGPAAGAGLTRRRLLREGVSLKHRFVFHRRGIHHGVGRRRRSGKLRAPLGLVVIFFSLGAFLHFLCTAVLSLDVSCCFE